jgi:competence protein ComEC
MLLLLINPLSAGSVSLQLSFASMAGILLLTGRISKRLNDLIKTKNKPALYLLRLMISSFASTIGASLFTTPLVALHFGYVSLYSPLTNLLTLSVLSLCFTLGYLTVILSLVCAPLGMAAGWILAWPLRCVIAAVKLIAKIPYCALYTENNFFALWLVILYVIFFLWHIGRAGKADRRFRPVTPICLSCVTLCCAILFTEIKLSLGRGYLTIVDVGQGECVVLTAGASTAVIDCGGDYAGDGVISYLLSRGRGHIGLLALTHLHADHCNAAAELLTRIKVDVLCLPEDDPDEDSLLGGILTAAEKVGTEVIYVSGDTAFTSASVTVGVFAPMAGTGANERGLVFSIKTGDFTALVMGDAGEPAERVLMNSGALPDCDALVVGHHGSKYSTGADFLSAVRPETAVISVGYNSYGHPTAEALGRLENAGAEIFRTDIHGTVEIRIK